MSALRAVVSLAAMSLAAAGQAEQPSFDVSGGVTAVGLYPTGALIADDRTMSADVYLRHATSGGSLLIYFEGNSTLNERRASTALIESNADAGTAIDPDRHGRIQVSEINYELQRPAGDKLTFGLLDASGYLDRTRITNDENVQFLGASFVNNPTIEFPDYTLGAVYQRPGAGARPEVNAVLTSTHGLVDNPNLSYSQLLQFSANDRGAFAALGLGWANERRLARVGGWVNTRPHDTLTLDRRDATNYGVNSVFGRSWGAHAMSVRLGAANDEVTLGSRFVSLAYRYRYRLRDHAIGAGVAKDRRRQWLRSWPRDVPAAAEPCRTMVGRARHTLLGVHAHARHVTRHGQPRRSVNQNSYPLVDEIG
jgi:hypothetical protein